MKGRIGVLWSFAAAFVAIALLAVFAFELADTQDKSRHDVTARVHERATLAASLIESLFQSSAAQAPVNARRYGTRVVSDRRMEANRHTSTYLVLLDSSGRVLAHSHGFTAQARAGLRRSAALALVRAGRPYGLGNVLPYGKSGVINFALPLRTPFGTRILLTGFSPALLSAFIGRELHKIPGVRGAHNYLIDGHNTVIASTNPKRKTGYVFDSPRQVKALKRPSGEGRGRYYVQVRLADSTWRLVLAAPSKELFKNVSGLRKWIPWMIFAAFALMTAAAFVLARRMLRSADQVRRTSAQLAVVNGELESTNAALGRRAAELARSNDELDQFASIASHDLQEPLRKVRTFTQQLMVMESESLSEKGRDYLQRTNGAAERMQRLVEDLLRFSRVATQARPFTMVDLGHVAGEVLDDLAHEVERRHAVVHVGDLPATRGDALQMRQLMQNLISNALKFQRDGVVPEVTIEATVAGDTATVTVSDNGIGFEQQYEQRIFRVFERLHGRTEYPGTGIGLALCRKIVERHGGTIHALSEAGAGSRFIVTLPINQQEELVVKNPPKDRDTAAGRSEGLVHV